jgi:hypothetical protein
MTSTRSSCFLIREEGSYHRDRADCEIRLFDEFIRAGQNYDFSACGAHCGFQVRIVIVFGPQDQLPRPRSEARRSPVQAMA